MTDNEIIKALECCAKNEWNCDDNCPFFKKCSKTLMAKSSLNIINRQKAEVERLNIELQSMRSAANSYKMHYETEKSEAIIEFAEMLKNCFAISGDYLDIINIIDNLVKEMTEVKESEQNTKI